MPLYECEICDYSTKIKTHFNRHCNTPKHQRNYINSHKINNEKASSKEKVKSCLKIEHPIQTSSDTSDTSKISVNISPAIIPKKSKKLNFECALCGRKLSSQGHLSRHMKSFCPELKTKGEIILKDMLEEQKEEFANERKTLYKQIEKLLDKVGNTTNIQSNIKNTITLNNYGQESMNHITNQLKTQLVKIPYVMIPKLIEAVHFNDSHPENKNIALTNSRDNKIKIFSDNRWIYKDKEETINDLVDGKYYILDAHYEQVGPSLGDDLKTNFIKFKEYFNSEDKEFINKLKRECEMVLLNNR